MVMVWTAVDVYTCVMVVVDGTSLVTVMMIGGSLGKVGVTSGTDPVPLGPVPAGRVLDPVSLGCGPTPVPAGLVEELCPVPLGCGITPVPEGCV